RFLSGVRNFSIGRTQVDYTALTVKDMSINGMNAEYQSRYSRAGAAGSIDYRFRDFVVADTRVPRQYLNLLRLGIGSKEGSHLIGSVFTGKRQRYGNTAVDSGGTAVNGVTGISLEGRWKIGTYSWLTGEIAKSNAPLQDYTNGAVPAKSFWDMKDHTSMAWS